MTNNLILYHTSHCHLCETAEALLNEFSLSKQICWSGVEIFGNSSLLTLYETKIPVLKRSDNGSEICWPFTLVDIDNLLK